jgi:hypothetical protein
MKVNTTMQESKLENLPDSNILKIPEGVDFKEVLKRLVYKSGFLVWKNFHAEQPQPDRWVVLWCDLGRISNNLILSYRDSRGNYELPHPTKSYPVQAWAYIDIPQVDESTIEQIQMELKTIANSSTENIPAKPLC